MAGDRDLSDMDVDRSKFHLDDIDGGWHIGFRRQPGFGDGRNRNDMIPALVAAVTHAAVRCRGLRQCIFLT